MWNECFICGEQEETANHFFMYSKMKSEVDIHVFVFRMERVILGSIAIISVWGRFSLWGSKKTVTA